MTTPMDERGDMILAADAYMSIGQYGVAAIAIHPACDVITLRNGIVLTHWHGDDEYGPRWEKRVA